MGQKVNPHGMRVGVIKDWDSRWFTSKQAFGDTLVEDHKIRKTLKKQLYAAGVPKIEIERTVDSQTGAPRVKVNVFCAKPGIVIGKGGAESAKIEKQLAKLTGKAVNLNIIEVKGTTTKRVPSPCRLCALTSTTASLRPTPPTVRSASRFGSTKARS